jgi:hypothetical protein
MSYYGLIGGSRRPLSTRRVSGKSRLAAELPAGGRGSFGTRAQVGRGTAGKTAGGLSLGNGLVRKNGRLRSVAVSQQSREKWNQNPVLQARAEAVQRAFQAVRSGAGGKGVNSRRIVADPEGAVANPAAFVLASRASQRGGDYDGSSRRTGRRSGRRSSSRNNSQYGGYNSGSNSGSNSYSSNGRRSNSRSSNRNRQGMSGLGWAAMLNRRNNGQYGGSDGYSNSNSNSNNSSGQNYNMNGSYNGQKYGQSNYGSSGSYY